MIDYAAIQDAIVQKLNEAEVGLEAVASPEHPLDFIDRLQKVNGAVTVSYRGTQFSEFMGLANFKQTARIQFDVNIVVKNLRDSNGAYAILNACRSTLSGFEIVKDAPLRCVQDAFVQMSEFMWLYTATYETTILEE